MAVIVEDGRLTLTGYVGESTLEIDGWVIFDGFTHAEVVAALGEIGPDADLTVHINSGGGYAIEGTAIRSVLADRDGRTDVVIDGIAASSASIIAMAGETVSMSLGSLMMIHDPSGGTWGTVADHEKSIKGLNSLGNSFARVYSRKSGKGDEECRNIMREETWFTPEEAVDAGFADDALDDEAGAVAAFPYQNYDHAPRDLVAQANMNGWRSPVPFTASKRTDPKPAVKPASKENPMANNPTPAEPTPAAPPTAAAAVTAADVKARIKAITEDDAAQGHEALAKHLAFDTDMPAEDAIAALTAASGDTPEANGEEVQPTPTAYQKGRMSAADLAQPQGTTTVTPQSPTLNTASIYGNRRDQKEA